MKWVCTVCKYVHEGDAPPESCPVCGQPREKFEPQKERDPRTGDRETTERPSAKRPRRWRCTVCQYIHEGDSPPDICPKCKKPWSAFIPDVTGPEGPRMPRPEPAKSEGKEERPVKANRWRCVVCNYVHNGSQPPDTCPVCGAGTESFVPETDSPEHHHRGLSGLIEKLHLHPVAAHFPNGAFPLALLSWLLFLAAGAPCFERASFYLMLVSVAAVPVTALTGWSDAKHRFGATTIGVFPEKKRWSWALVAVSLSTTAWRLALGWLHAPTGGLEVGLYTVLLVAATAMAARLGMLGGKLIFGH